MGFDCVISVAPCMKRMAPRGVSMVRSLLVMAGLMMLGGLRMVTCGMCMVL
jgi:hypothetical protein